MSIISKKISIAILGVVIISVIVLYAYFNAFSSEKCRKIFTYLNPRVGCVEIFSIDKKDYTQFQHALNRVIQTWENQGRVTKVGLMFRDLEAGPMFTIDADNRFAPASLLKLPVAMTIFKVEEESPGLLSKTFTVEKVLNDDRDLAFPPPHRLEEGKEYTVEEAVQYSLSFSDNRANAMLNEILKIINPETDLVLDTLRELGLVLDDAPGRSISVRGYSALLRQLYNASYLNSEGSEKILTFLSESSFNNGLKASVLPGVRVANKFGENTLPDGSYQLHDCGIVYYPGNPYALCLMTEGFSKDELVNIIRMIGEMVYQEVDSRKLTN